VHCHLFDAIANRRPTRSYIHMREGPPAEDTICSRGCLFIVKSSIEGTSGTMSAVSVQCEPVVRSVDLHYPSTCTCSVQMSRYWSSCPPSLRLAYEMLLENIPQSTGADLQLDIDDHAIFHRYAFVLAMYSSKLHYLFIKRCCQILTLLFRQSWISISNAKS